MSDEIALRCYFAATTSTRSQLASAVTVHAATRPRALALLAAIFGVVAAVIIGLDPDNAATGALTALGITLLAGAVEAIRAWVAAYRSLESLAAAGARTQSGFVSDRFRLHSADGDEIHLYLDLAAIVSRGSHVLMRTRADGQRWFVYPRALFPDAEVERIQTVLASAPHHQPAAPATHKLDQQAVTKPRTSPSASGGFNDRRPPAFDAVPDFSAGTTPDPTWEIASDSTGPVAPLTTPRTAPPALPKMPAPYRRPPTEDPNTSAPDLPLGDIRGRALAPAPTTPVPAAGLPRSTTERIEDVTLTARFIAGPGTVDDLARVVLRQWRHNPSTWIGVALMFVVVTAMASPVVDPAVGAGVALVLTAAVAGLAVRVAGVRARAALRASYFPGALLQAGFGRSSVRWRTPTGEHLVHHHALTAITSDGAAVLLSWPGFTVVLPRQLFTDDELARLRHE